MPANSNYITTTNVDDDSETQPKHLSLMLERQARIQHRNIKQIDSKLSDPYNQHAYSPMKDNTVTWIPGAIPLVPDEYHRPRTVFEVIDPSNLVQNITKCLKLRSIHVVYDEATATCKTSSYMKFTIRLLRQHNTNTILVDVRRRDGCCIVFRDEYQALYRATVFGDIIPIQIPCSISLSVDMECMQSKHNPLEASAIERSLETSIAHLGSKIYDTRMLTLQDLLSITDPASKETSLIACKLMLEEKYLTIFEYVASDIMTKVDYSDCRYDDSEEHLRSLTLNLLGNILCALQNNILFASMIQKRQCYANITESLIWYTENAEKCPWNACLAVKCLRLLWPISTEARPFRAVQCLYGAETFGKCSHDFLEKETEKALAVMSI